MVSVNGGITYEAGKAREWLIANGLGGYASSTITGANTRKYHGLLVASKNPPVERRLLLSKLEETVEAGGDKFSLSTNKYPGTVYPKGYECLKSFSLAPLPTFGYSIGGTEIKKIIFTVHKKNATVIRYEVKTRGPAEISLSPLANDRDFHANTTEKINFSQDARGNGTSIRRDGKDVLLLQSDACAFSKKESWYENMLYDLETERGEGDRDSHFCPGEFGVQIAGDSVFHILATDGTDVGTSFEQLYRDELERLKTLRTGDDVPESLLYSADSFRVFRKSTGSESIIAGYHWFADWGRDSMISLPGLALETNRFDFARSVLDTFAQKVVGGLVPNVFSDSGEGTFYNSADSSLWFVVSAYKYLKKTQDEDFFRRRLWGAVKEIILAYRRGTGGVRMDEDCLIACEPGLTWMDAFVDGRPVTPRSGKPVEINALWYNSLEMTHELANRFGERPLATETRELARSAKKSFSKFWNQERGCLFDVIEPIDPSVRPNQIFALSLLFGILDAGKESKTLEVVERDLLTPYGLRSLSRSDGRYRGKYSGDRRTRDFAYHNGTVWSWLIGPYADACAKVRGRDEARNLTNALKEFVEDKGMGSVPELFEADTLEPKGCFSQAWGVSEWLRVIREYGE